MTIRFMAISGYQPRFRHTTPFPVVSTRLRMSAANGESRRRRVYEAIRTHRRALRGLRERHATDRAGAGRGRRPGHAIGGTRLDAGHGDEDHRAVRAGER